MLKWVTALSAALIAAGAFVGSATDASAHRRHGHGCSSCGPISPSYTYKTKTVHRNITRYRDVTRTRFVPRIKPIVHVTRIQPVVHVHNVTRVHTRIVGVVHPVHRHMTYVLPPRLYMTGSVVYLRPQCGCSYRHY
jgi:hypothetical protein